MTQLQQNDDVYSDITTTPVNVNNANVDIRGFLVNPPSKNKRSHCWNDFKAWSRNYRLANCIHCFFDVDIGINVINYHIVIIIITILLYII